MLVGDPRDLYLGPEFRQVVGSLRDAPVDALEAPIDTAEDLSLALLDVGEGQWAQLAHGWTNVTDRARTDQISRRATFLGWLDGDDLPRAYTSADLFLFCSGTDTFGQVLVEAGASGLSSVAVDEGGPSSIVIDGETGRLCDPDPGLLAAAILQLADSPAWRAKLGRQAMEAAHGRTWEAAMMQLADGYDRVTESAEEPAIRLVRAA